MIADIEDGIKAATKAVLLLHYTEEQADDLIGRPIPTTEWRDAHNAAETAVSAFLAVSHKDEDGPKGRLRPPYRGGDC